MALRRYLSIGVMLVASAVILAATVWVVGFEKTQEAVHRAGWTPFLAVGLLKLLFLTCQAAAWAALNRPIQHKAKFHTLFEAVVIGQAGNVVTPSTYLGGEPFKIMYLGKMARLPYHEVAGTVLLSKYLEFLSFILVFAFSTAAAVWTYRGILFRAPLFVLGGALIGCAAALLCFSVILWIALSRRWRPLTRLVGLLGRLFPGWAWLARLKGRAAETEDQVSRVFCEEGKTSLIGFGYMLVGHAAIFLYPLLFIYLLREPLRLRTGEPAYLSLGELSLIFAACQFILAIQLTPSGAGMLDGGLIGVFALIGLDRASDVGTCMAYLLCLRIWDAVVIGAGVVLGMRVGARILGGKRPALENEQAPDCPAPGARPAPAADAVPRPDAQNSPGAGRTPFPYAFTPLAGLPRHLRFRAEGRPPRDSVLYGLRYVRKYRSKLRAAPTEEVAYFGHQRQLLDTLAREEPGADGASLAMVGDLMWIRNEWTAFLAPEVLDALNRHDVVLGNLETVISPRFRVPRLLPDCAWFNSDPALVTSFRRPDGRSTFTALAFANNHVLDFRDAGVEDVLAFLEGQGILCSGVREAASGRPYVTFTARGIRFGFYAATWGVNDARRQARSRFRINTVRGLASEEAADLSEVQAVLAAMAAEGVDFRIVALHWGFEYELYPSPRHMQAAREIVRAGADVILGTHPHVLQPSEVCFLNGYESRYGEWTSRLPALSHPGGCILQDPTGRPRKALVLYSLGNFTTAMYTFLCRLGCIQGIRVARDPRTGGVDWSFSPATLVYNAPRDPATRKRRLVLLRDYLREAERNGPLPKKTLDDLAFLRAHVVANGVT